MNDDFFGFVDVVLIISVVLFNYFFLYMWKILYGKKFHLSPTWKWLQDIKELKKMSLTAENDELRQKCKFVLNGIYISTGLLIFGILFGFIL